MGFFSKHQHAYDTSRDSFILTFQPELPEERVTAFLRSIGTSLLPGSHAFDGTPTIVFEVVVSPNGIQHIVRFPKGKGQYLMKMLRTSVDGIGYQEYDDKTAYKYDYGVSIKMHNGARTLALASESDYSARLLGSMQDAVEDGDELILQWVIRHSNAKRIAHGAENVSSANTTIWQALMGKTIASPEEIGDRRAKQSDQMFLATGRIAAKAANQQRAARLVNDVVTALTSESGAAYFNTKPVDPVKLSDQIEFARTPLIMTAELSTKELSGVIAWPMGSRVPDIPGLVRGTTQHRPPTNGVPRNGLVLGRSTMPGVERPIALDWEKALTHLYIGGATEVGKTTLAERLLRQTIDKGYGAFVFEYEGNLLNKGLNQVPAHRLDDVIVIDFTRNQFPVGLNIIKLGSPSLVAGQLTTLLEAIYPDNKSVYTRKLISHIIPALEVVPNATLADVLVMANPRNPVELAWARDVAGKQKDRPIKQFLTDWLGKSKETREKDSQALENRLWEILTPAESRYLVTQETSSFDPYDVINNNRLLFVNFAGVSEQVASLIGSFIVSALWRAASASAPEKPNLMFIDEFQYFSRLNSDFEDMLATARRKKLGLVLATQYVERLPTSTQDAIAANARSKIIFQSSPKSAQIHQRDFADRTITAEQIVNLKAFDALARINTKEGTSRPFTMHTYPEAIGYGHGQRAFQISEQKYGRNIESIDAAEVQRRRPTTPTQQSHKPIGTSTYDVPDDQNREIKDDAAS
ncbi:type IV secretory system conjugative DNA transfer family protein [Rhodococcus erythropolis]